MALKECMPVLAASLTMVNVLFLKCLWYILINAVLS
jgi:hypothetical protein